MRIPVQLAVVLALGAVPLAEAQTTPGADVQRLTQQLQRLTDEREISHVTDLMFIYTDQKNWDALRDLYVGGPITVDFSSLNGGGPQRMTAQQLVDGYRAGLFPDKASHHMSSNHNVMLSGGRAQLWAQGYAWNHLENRGGADLWETWGTYRLGFVRTPQGWRMNSFVYTAKYNRGNEGVRTAQPPQGR